MQQLNVGTAYVLWCLCFFGICGGQRFYSGKVGSGVIYLFTFGLLGLGQVIDLLLVPEMVSSRNVYLRGLGGNASQNFSQNITLNLGELASSLPPKLSSAPSKASSMQRLLEAAKDHGGKLSVAQAAMCTELEPEVVNRLLQQAVKFDYAEVANDPKSGAVRYHFDV